MDRTRWRLPELGDSLQVRGQHVELVRDETACSANLSLFPLAFDSFLIPRRDCGTDPRATKRPEDREHGERDLHGDEYRTRPRVALVRQRATRGGRRDELCVEGIEPTHDPGLSPVEERPVVALDHRDRGPSHARARTR